MLHWLSQRSTSVGIAIGCTALGLSAAGAAAAATPNYHIIARYAIGGNEISYDYIKVDAPLRRVYVAHFGRVEVLDADTGKPVGTLTETHGVHGIELIPALGKGYTSDGLDRAVRVFDRKTLATIREIKYTGVKPDAIKYDPQTKRLYVVNGGSTGDVTVIDPATDSIVDTIDLHGEKLEQIGFDGRGHAFVNDEGRSAVHVFDTRTHKPLADWPLAGCEEPTGMAMDAPHHRLFSSCGNGKLAVVDTDTGRVVATPDIGEDPDSAAFDPKTHYIFTSSHAGTLSVIHEVDADHYEPVQTVTTEIGARTVGLDEQTGRLFLPAATPAPTPENKAAIVPGSFVVLAVGP